MTLVITTVSDFALSWLHFQFTVIYIVILSKLLI